MKSTMVSLQADPLNGELLDRALDLARVLREFPFRLNLWQAQNIWNDMLSSVPRVPNEPRAPGRSVCGIVFSNLAVSSESPSKSWWSRAGTKVRSKEQPSLPLEDTLSSSGASLP